MTEMIKIKMLRNEGIQTSKGTLNFKEGDEVSVEEWIAASLAGRGMAVIIKAKEELKALTAEQLDKMTVVQLRKLGRDAKVPGYNSLAKDKLVEALAPQEPADSPFEPIELTPEGSKV